jgi:hypothetical protein
MSWLDGIFFMNLIEINARNEKLITCDGVGKDEKRRILAAIIAEAFADGQENILYAQQCEGEAVRCNDGVCVKRN